jgi:hypothetical protein
MVIVWFVGQTRDYHCQEFPIIFLFLPLLIVWSNGHMCCTKSVVRKDSYNLKILRRFIITFSYRFVWRSVKDLWFWIMMGQFGHCSTFLRRDKVSTEADKYANNLT